MKKIISILTIAIITVMTNNILACNVYAHEGKLDSYGGHCVMQGGYITAYHFHEGQLDGYEITLTTPIKAENIEDLKKYVKTLDIKQLAKLGTIRKMPVDTATPNQTVNPSATPTPTITAIAINTPKTISKTMPKTGEKENINILIAGVLIIVVGCSIGLVVKHKANM